MHCALRYADLIQRQKLNPSPINTAIGSVLGGGEEYMSVWKQGWVSCIEKVVKKEEGAE